MLDEVFKKAVFDVSHDCECVEGLTLMGNGRLSVNKGKLTKSVVERLCVGYSDGMTVPSSAVAALTYVCVGTAVNDIKVVD